MARKIIVIGSGAAGMSAASNARNADPEAEITVFTEDTDVAYSPCMIPWVLQKRTPGFRPIFRRQSPNTKRTGPQAIRPHTFLFAYTSTFFPPQFSRRLPRRECLCFTILFYHKSRRKTIYFFIPDMEFFMDYINIKICTPQETLRSTYFSERI